jgi:O-antigen/teichoic acid export membrane protein
LPSKSKIIFLDKNIKVAKNTILLYLRTVITVFISLFTSRIILQSLGVDSFGVYVVVNSIVGFSSFFSATLQSTSNRFIAFRIGEGNKQKLKNTFGSLLSLHLIFSIILVLLIEFVGIWFLNNYIVIPEGKLNDAHIIFQFSIIIFFISLNSSPFLSSLISYERFKVYAYLTIISITIKLVLVYFLLNIDYNKLIIFSIFMLIQQIITNLLYVLISIYTIDDITYTFKWDKIILLKIINYSSWTFYSLFIMIFTHHSMVFVINYFFGPVINGSLGIARQLTDLINNLRANFTLAITPSITKSYANNEISQYKGLVFKGSKFGFFIMLFILLPLIFEIKFVLKFWLDNPPIYCAHFVVLILIDQLIDSLVSPLEEYVNSQGNIKRFKLIVYTYIAMILPISVYLIYLGFPPYYIFFVNIFFTTTSILLRLYLTSRFYDFDKKNYYGLVLLPIIKITLISLAVPISIYIIFDQSVYRFLITVLLTSISTFCVIYKIGLTLNEKQILIKLFNKFLMLR